MDTTTTKKDLVLDCIPVALRGEDGSDTGRERTDTVTLLRGSGNHLAKRRSAPLKQGQYMLSTPKKRKKSGNIPS